MEKGRLADLVTGGNPNVHHIRWMKMMIQFVHDCYTNAGDYKIDDRVANYGAVGNKDLAEQAVHVLNVFEVLEKLVEERNAVHVSDKETDMDIINRMFPIPD